MKKFLLLAAMLVCVLSLVIACKKAPVGGTLEATDASWNGTDYAPEKDAKLKLWLDNEDVAKDLIALWAKQFPDVPVTFEKVGSIDASSKLALDGPAGLGADVFVQPHDKISTSYQDGILLPFAHYEDQIKKNFNASSVAIAYIDGKQYGVPYSLENLALFYNKDLVKVPAKNWDELLAFAKTYNDPKKNKWAIRWAVNDAYISFQFLSAYGFQLFGPNHNDPANPGWDSPEVIEGLKFFKSVRPYFNVPAEDTNWDFTTIEFAKGNVPYLFSGPWSIPDSKKAKLNFGVVPLPMFPGNRQPIPFSGTQMITVSSYTKFPNAARRFAMFMTTDDALAILYKYTNKLPAKNDISNIEGLRDDEYLKGFAAQAQYTIPMPTIKEMVSAWEPQRTMLQLVWNGKLTPEAAAKKAVTDYQTLLKAQKK